MTKWDAAVQYDPIKAPGAYFLPRRSDFYPYVSAFLSLRQCHAPPCLMREALRLPYRDAPQRFDLLVFTGLFALVHVSAPLYTSNQHTYFLHGLARTGRSLLRHDWLVGTADPFPVFSALVAGLDRIGGEALFFVSHALLATAVALTGAERQRLQLYVLGFTLLVVHSAHFASLTQSLLGVNLGRVLTYGVAAQTIVRPFLDPSSFGVFLLLAVYLLVRGRLWQGVLSAAFAGLFHASYLLPAAVLTLIAAGLAYAQDRRFGRPLIILGLALAVVAPYLVYALIAFSQPDAAVTAVARRILVEERIPHHALPSHWFDGWAALQLTLVVVAMLAIRRHRRGLQVLGSLALFGVLGTALQLATGSHAIALLFPWRVSTLLVPVATAVLIASAIGTLARRTSLLSRLPRPAWTALCLGGVVMVLAYSVPRQAERFENPRRTPPALLQYIAETAQPGDLYVTPLRLESFRLQTGAPVLVDWKSHPYRADEIVEWNRRVQAVRAIYDAGSTQQCRAIRRLTERYGITHLLLPDTSASVHCSSLAHVRGGAALSLYRVRERGV